ncbi:MAG: DUF364 domain-containing protein [Anaerolineae bacterium]
MTGSLTDDLLNGLPEGRVLEVAIGLHWTGVVAEVAGERRCGLATTLRHAGHTHGEYDVPDAGRLTGFKARALAALAHQAGPQRSLGFAAINALLPRTPARWVDANAADVIAERGAGRTVALVGHFPFVEVLRPRVGTLHVLEQNPLPGDLPAEAAAEVLPAADVVAITGLTLLNGTFEELIGLCAPEATVLVLGPTTPLHPALFARGVDLLSGAVVEDIDAVMTALREGANFRQLHRAGVRLVTMGRGM